VKIGPQKDPLRGNVRSFRRWLVVLPLIPVLAGCGPSESSSPGSGVGGGAPSSAGGSTGSSAGGSTGSAGGPGNPVDAGSPAPGGDAGTPNQPPVSVPVAGVATGDTCFPLCVTSSATSGDYGYENGKSCVVPTSYTAMINKPCTVGAALPPTGHPAGSAGVVSGAACVALCGPEVLDAAPVDSAPGDGWGWEFGAACVMRGSTVALTSTACTTGTPIGDGSANTGAPGRLLSESCVRLCTVITTADGGSGYGFEFGAACVIPGTAAAAQGIDCKVGVPELTGPPIVLNPNPPAGQVRKPAAMLTRGFFVTGGRLYDKFGNDFVPRGINNPDAWFDIYDQYFAYNALDNIAAYGANAVRIVWSTASPGTPALLRRIIRHVVELRMVPIVELHDVTGGTSNQDLLTMAAYYASAPVKQILLDFEEFLLVNIANEWSGTDFRGGYQAAVAQLRAAGINHTLVIDANGFGQNANSIVTDGAALLAADPQHNLLFSVHMYDAYNVNAGGRTKITSTLQQIVTLPLPLMVGEFGWQTGTPPVAIDAAFIISECVRLKLGYLGWSWKGNAQSYLDLAVDWEGTQLSSWGNTLIKGAGGLMTSSTKATIYTQ
jgi:mannan endo-1,4-beta-mannosidase